jgi:uncharacterized membrane protein
MNLELLVKLIHILSSVALITGITGRQLTRAFAGKAEDISTFNSFLELSKRFENLFVIPGSLLVFLVGIIISLLRGWPLLGFIQGSTSNWLLVSLILYLLSFLMVIFVFKPRGKIFRANLNDALARNKLTNELIQSFKDKVVRAAHLTEFILIGIVMYLMVMKPF